MNFLSNEMAKEFKKIADDIDTAEKEKRHNVRCQIEAIIDAKKLNDDINTGHLS